MLAILLSLCLLQAPKATHEDYATVVKIYENYAARVNDARFWARVEVDTNDRRGVVGFEKISKAEQKIFIYMLLTKLTAEGDKLQKSWGEELKKFGKDSYKSDDPKVAKGDEVAKYAGSLLAARKKMAVEFERFLKECRAELRGEANDYELAEMEGRVAKMHDGMKLVDRK